MNYKRDTEVSVMHRFDAFVKKVIKNAAINYDNAKANKYFYTEPLEEVADEIATLEIDESIKYKVYGELCEVSEYLSNFIDKLPNTAKAVLLLYYFGGLSEPEIAKLLNVSKTAINKQRKKALIAMRELLERKSEPLQ